MVGFDRVLYVILGYFRVCKVLIRNFIHNDANYWFSDVGLHYFFKTMNEKFNNNQSSAPVDHFLPPANNCCR